MSAHLSQLIFQRGEILYSATVDAKNVGEPHLLLRSASISIEDRDPLWAVAPDVSQIVYKKRMPEVVENEATKTPQAVYIATLPDMAGAEIKSRCLFYTGDLRDIHGRKVRTFPPFALLPHQSKDYPSPALDIDEGWVISSLRWSNRGDRLYVSLCWAMNTQRGYATCVVDAQTGRVLTDAAGSRYRLLETGTIDESRDGLLVGCGQGRTYDEQDVCNACSRYRPLYMASRTHKTPVSLLPGRFNSKNKPKYGFAENCAVAPEGKRIAFVSDNQLWLTSVNAPRYTRLLAPSHAELSLGDIAWLGEHTLIYHQIKYVKSGNAWKKTGKLWRLPMVAGGHVAAQPSLFLDNVEDFALLSR